jgi:hypothetical protein
MPKVVRSFYCPEELTKEINEYLPRVERALGEKVSKTGFYTEATWHFLNYLEGMPTEKIREILSEPLPYPRGQTRPPLPFKVELELDDTIRELLFDLFGQTKAHQTSKSHFYTRACRHYLKHLKEKNTERELKKIMEERGVSS